MGVSMRSVLRLAGVLLAALALPACSTSSQTSDGSAKLAYAAEAKPADTDSFFVRGGGPLAGRSISVGNLSDIRLRDREVVLTFDDGPMPGRTESVLKVLDRYRVKATFLMVGRMARSHPAIARRVAARGHSIGTHTDDHANLAGRSFAAATADIEAGRLSVAAATGMRPSTFFRFPYLASTPALRRYLAGRNVVVIDADIDSKDYFRTNAGAIRQRILSQLGRKRSGIILMHDIHARTAAMLPGLLDDLKTRGYKVVHLVPSGRGLGDLVASAPHRSSFGYADSR